MASNGKVSNISEALQKAKGPHLWDETFSGPLDVASRNGTREDRAKCFTKVIFNEENVCHLTAELKLEICSDIKELHLSLEFLSKWQKPSRLSYEINFEAKRESTSPSGDLTIFKIPRKNLDIKQWFECGDSLKRRHILLWNPNYNILKKATKFRFNFRIQGIEFPLPAKPAKAIQIIGPSMTEAMKNMFLEGKMSDIKIKCEDQEFFCHKIILCTRSDVFETMFNGVAYGEATNGILEIEDMDAETMRKFLTYIYTDKIEYNEVDLNLIYVADKYNVLRLVSECAVVLSKKITNDNVLDVLKAGFLVENNNLFEAAMDYLVQNKLMAKKKGEWTALKTAYPGLGVKVAEYFMFE